MLVKNEENQPDKEDLNVSRILFARYIPEVIFEEEYEIIYVPEFQDRYYPYYQYPQYYYYPSRPRPSSWSPGGRPFRTIEFIIIKKELFLYFTPFLLSGAPGFGGILFGRRK